MSMKNLIALIITIGLTTCGFTDVAHARNDGEVNGAGCVNNCGRGGNGGSGGAGGVGIGVGGAGGSSSSSSSAAAVSGSSSGAAANLNYIEAQQDYSDTYEDYTPSAYAPSINSTTPCLVAVTGGVGVPGLSVSGGSGVIDQGCEDREVIRLGLASSSKRTQDLANRLLQARLTDVLVRDEQEALEADIAAERSADAGSWDSFRE